jgi:hypothetical protein
MRGQQGKRLYDSDSSDAERHLLHTSMMLKPATLTLAPYLIIPVMKMLQNRQQFYFTVVYLTTNKLCICVLANLVFSQLLAAGRALKTVSSMLY